MIPRSNCQGEKQEDGIGCRPVRSRETELPLSCVKIAGEIICPDKIIQRESRQNKNSSKIVQTEKQEEEGTKE